jgi:2'-5' RNA ligase
MRVAEDVAESLDRVRRPVLDLRLNGVSALGTKRPHAIVAVAEPTAVLLELQAEHERILQRIGLPPEGRKYTPHVTLARLRHGHPRDIAEYLTLRGGFFAQPFAVERFVLFSSRDSTGGGPYIAEETYDLSPPAAAPLEERPWPGN